MGAAPTPPGGQRTTASDRDCRGVRRWPAAIPSEYRSADLPLHGAGIGHRESRIERGDVTAHRGGRPSQHSWLGDGLQLLWMTRIHRQLLVASICVLAASITPAQNAPITVTIASLSLHPREMDGKLVRVRARYEAGWEGDSFLVDPPDAVIRKGAPSTSGARLWIYCDPRNERNVCGPVFEASAFRSNKGALGTFTGYFHFVPDEKSQLKKGVFQAGPFRFSAVSVSDLVQQSR